METPCRNRAGYAPTLAALASIACFAPPASAQNSGGKPPADAAAPGSASDADPARGKTADLFVATHDVSGKLGTPLPLDVRLVRVGAIVEEPRFYPYLTGRENLEINAAARGGAAAMRIPESLERVGLSARASERVASYSLGMRQRLGIARCLLADPELLFLDEPMNGLDPAGMLEVRALIRHLVREGRTVFLSSHLLDEVQRTSDFAAIVDRGKVVTQGSIDELTAGVRRVSIGTDDPGRAAALIARLNTVDAAAVADGGVVVSLASNGTTEREQVTEIVRRMLDADLSIDRVAPVEASLEERFLSITQRLEDEQ